jgi:hypothetical protein
MVLLLRHQVPSVIRFTVGQIAMKNTNVDAVVIPQVLKYAIWAETNPDSIKAL